MTVPRVLERLAWNAFVLWHMRREWRLPYWPTEKLTAVQSRRVRSIVEHAYATVPFYRDVMRREGLRPEDFRSADDLAQLPTVTRQQLADEPERLASEAYPDAATVTCLTTGTSGVNRSIRYDRAAAFLSLAGGQRSRLVGRHFTGRVLRLRQIAYGSALSSAVSLRSLYESLSWTPRVVDHDRNRAQATGPLEEHAERLNRVRPHMVGGYGVYLGSLFRHLHERGLEFHRPRLVQFWGEAMPEPDRRFIEEELGIPVRGVYSTTESLRLAWQCERRDGYHVDIDVVAIRVVDAEGREVGPGGTGELLLSNLTNRATVLLNYRVGDVVTRATGPCPCGRTLPLLARVEGRSDDLVHHPDGYDMHVWAVLAGVQSLPGVVNVQLVQRPGARFRLNLVVRAGIDREQTALAAGTELRRALGEKADLDVHVVDAIAPEPGGKVRLVISKDDS